MKKIFKKAIVCLGILSMGLTSTSCDSETITQIIGALITNLLTQQPGTTYTFSGKGTNQLLIASKDSNTGYIAGGKESSFTGNVALTIAKNNTCTLTLPAMAIDGGAKMSEVTFSNLSMIAGNENTKIDTNENSTGLGTLTVGNQTYELSNVYLETSAGATNQKLNLATISIYFGENYEYVVNLTNYVGNVVTQ